MKLSIIIPVYHVEKTLDTCVESILSQKYEDCEILLVDDGSPDGCPALCDQWAGKDVRIKTFHKANGGLSDARNYGLQQAQGDYVTFVDSDDEIAPDTLSVLMPLIDENPDCDILEYAAKIHVGNENEHLLNLPYRKWSSAREYWLQTEAWEHCYAWNKIYRRTFIGSTQFPKGRIFEDMWFYPELLQREPQIITTSQGTYLYKWNEKGITVSDEGPGLYQLLEGQIRARKMMRTTLLSKNGWKLYRSMLYRQIDVYRLTGNMLLHWPLLKTVCWLHKKGKKKG